MSHMKRFDHKQIRELLENGIRPSMVARIVGCSREYVRQLDLQYFGLTGRQRSRMRRVDTSKTPPNHPFVAAAKKQGYKVEAVRTTVFRASTFRVLINGFRCGLFTASKRNIRTDPYWVIRRSAWDLDFYIWTTPMGYIILPKNKQPNGATTIAITNKRLPGAGDRRHDYMNYLNKWEQLERKRKIA